MQRIYSESEGGQTSMCKEYRPPVNQKLESYCFQCLTVLLSPLFVPEGFLFLDHRAHLPGLAQRFLSLELIHLGQKSISITTIKNLF